ncbi:hypothetical protein [Altererythrobacter sp. B11]|uniref:hypothetical protein n=1 Tax=Altererythrobacter sp. B11 TaxID=2060312 RepID=UPI000E5B3BC3|nr:hypothetical protein [Altererythrobacter sp. B11]
MQQVPKWLFPVLFAVVGVPLILWDAGRTSGQLDALDSRETREANCRRKLGPLGLSGSEADNLCRCVVAEAEARGVTTAYGGYDKATLAPVLQLCAEAHGIR